MHPPIQGGSVGQALEPRSCSWFPRDPALSQPISDNWTGRGKICITRTATLRCLVWPLPDLIGEGESVVDALLLKVPEAPAQLGISRAKLYELIAAGTLPSVKVGGCRRIRASDLREFVQQLSATV